MASGSVATDALIVTVAQRSLATSFPKATMLRGDGSVTFTLGQTLKREKDAADIIESIGQAILRELTGKPRLVHGDKLYGDIDFNNLRDKVLSFTELMTFGLDVSPGSDVTSSGTFSALPDLFDLPTHESVRKMLELLYHDAVSRQSGFLCVAKFPKQLSIDDNRLDVIIGAQVLFSVFSQPSEDSSGGVASAVLQIQSRAFANIIAPFASMPVELELPSQWRQRLFTLEEAPEVLEVVLRALSNYWNSSTKTDKAKVNATSLLSIVSGDLKEFIREHLAIESADINGTWRMSVSILERADAVSQKWLAFTERLTVKGEWESWTGGPFVDASFQELAYRLSSVVRIRHLVDESLLYLQRKDLLDVDPEVLFEGLAVGDLSAATSAKWRAAEAKFNAEFDLLESNLIGRLRSAWQRLASNGSDATLREASAIRDLLLRPKIAAALADELQAVASYLRGLLDEVKQRYASRLQGAKTSFAKIAAARDLIDETAPVMESATSVLSKGAMEHLQSTADSMVTSATTAADAALGSWKAEATASAKDMTDKHLVTVTRMPHPVERSGGLSYFTCHVDASLSQFLTELAAMSIFRPSAVAELGADASRNIESLRTFVPLANRLHHMVATYNGISKQILPCTRQMLQASLGRAEVSLLGNGESQRNFGVASTAELDMVVSKTQRALEVVNSDNRAVRALHTDLGVAISGLFAVDLLRHPEQWRSVIKDLRSRFETFERNKNLNAAGVDAWKRHWDYQLYKALEYQYQVGLEQLNESIDPFTVSLLFRQTGITFKPTFEALRESYYAKLKDFISIPNKFKGMSNAEFFAKLPSRNAKAVTGVHLKAMELFAKLNKLRRQFRDFVVVGVCGMSGTWDLDTLVSTAVTTVEGYEEGFALCKERLKKVHAVFDKITVECVEVHCDQLKAAMEDHVRKLEDALVTALRRATQQRLSEVDEFVHRASSVIERQPTTLDEVGQANKAYIDFKEQLPVMEQKLEEQDRLQKLLKQVTGSTIDMSVTKSRWEHLMEAMQSFQKLVDASISKMRHGVDAMVVKLLKDVQRFTNHWNQNKPKDVASFKTKKDFETGLNYVKDQVLELADVSQQAAEVLEKCRYFKVPPPDVTALRSLEADVKINHTMWMFYESFDAAFEEHRREDWLTYRTRLYRFEDFLKDWEEKTVAQLEPSCVVAAYLQQMFAEWRAVIPLLKFVRGEGMLPEHWNEMFRLLEIDKTMTSDQLTFGNIIDKHKNIIKFENELKLLYGRAQGEVQIRDALQELRTWAVEATFTLTAPSTADGGAGASRVMLITEWKHVLTQVSDHQSLLASIKDSVYFPRFADEASVWEQKLMFVNDCLLLLNSIQRRWVYLEPLFSRGALPHEQQRFKRVDKEFVAILKDVEQDPRIMSLAAHTDYSDKLKAILEQIERCQRSLNEFLEQKRDKFPRFYFISDEDLLEILGQSKSPAVIQSHLKKLFMGINSVRFNTDSTAITHMVSSDGEVVPLAFPVPITGADVEGWLIELDHCMRKTLRKLLVECASQTTVTDINTIGRYPSQILQVAEQIIFTRYVEQDVISRASSGGIAAGLQTLQARLDALTAMDTAHDAVIELKVKALIMDVIHMSEVLQQLRDAGIQRVTEWQWQKQLRYYLTQDGTCKLHMVDTVFNYSYEYQGNAAKLVHTPLTDRCYLTLTKGMQLGYGGNLYGPAGTGKTESVKALGGAMGRQVLVFNCDEGIDFKAMGRIFVGIVKCGAWGCFDEFNRLKVDQLSAISQMIQIIQEALKQGEPTCQLLGRVVEVDPNSGIFVTLNPAGKGYGGRSKLPDNLKLLFRSIAMSVPNSELIAENMLLSEGFRFAKALAPKVIETYKLSKQLLSPQQHYDWGLRPLKAVLRLGGSLIQKLRQQEASTASRTEEQESVILVQSIRVNTLSKLTRADATLFSGIVDDVFPKIVAHEIQYEELSRSISDAIAALGLQQSEVQARKVMQLYEALNQRMGVVLVGPSGSGKTTLLTILRKALQLLGHEVAAHVVNPKALPRQQLLGYMDIDTREWFDGVLSAAARKVVKEPLSVRSWICCDGDIDPEWVESLNSVLDDNRLLTMPNGVRIQFGSNVNFIFETHSLRFASPATVSRMGIIFCSSEDVDPRNVVLSYAARHMSAEARDRVLPWIDQYGYAMLDAALAKGDFAVETTPMTLIKAVLAHTEATETKEAFIERLMRALTLFMPVTSQAAFAKFIIDSTGVVKLNTDATTSALDFYVDPQRQKEAVFQQPRPGEAVVSPAFLMDGNSAIPMIRTVEMQRILRSLEPLIVGEEGRPFILYGPEGCGKDTILARCFESLKSARIAVIDCSAQTNSAQVVHKLQQYCSLFSTTAGKVLRPKEAERLVIVLKDIHLPKPDKYGTVMLHSFLQQLILYRGFYDAELEWVGVEKVQIVGSMTSVSASVGGFPISPRFLSIVNTVTIGYPSTESLSIIYSALFGALVRTPQFRDGRNFDNGVELATAATTMYGKIRKRFAGEAFRFCIFSPRDITTMVTNATRYDVSTTSLEAIIAYEAARIFTDRLPKADDRQRADRIIAESLATLGYTYKKEGEQPPLFSSVSSEWMTRSTPADQLKTPIGTRPLVLLAAESLKKTLEMAVTAYGREYGDLAIALIPEVVDWIARVDRALSAPNGHLLLVGRSGVGRRAAVIIASYQLKMDLVKLNMGKDYSLKQFRVDLKAVIAKAALENIRVTLLIEEFNLFSDDILEMLNTLISAGEVPGLYSQDELDQLLPTLRDSSVDDGFTGGLYQYFIMRLRLNLKVCITMDSRHPLFAVRCQSNPALLTRCTVLWMDVWSEEGMKLFCKTAFRDVLKESLKDDEKLNVPHELINAHKAIGDRGTPDSFSALMNAFKRIYSTKSKASREQAARLKAGLQKLKEAQDQVDVTKKNVTKKLAEVEKKQQEADEALSEIQQNMAESADQRSRAQDLTARLADEKTVIASKSEKIAAELATIQPMLDAAREAVSGIKSENLNEIRSLKTPPEAIRDVLEGVLGLLGVQDVSWKGMCKFLGERGVKERIIDFDAKSITAASRDHVVKLLQQRANSFKNEVIVRASVAAAPLAAWVKANVEYSTVLDRIDPLKQQLDELEASRTDAETKLKQLQIQLKKIDANIEQLRKDFAMKCKEAERLKEELEKAEKQLAVAEVLLAGLSDERDRWGDQSQSIDAVLRSIPRKAVVCAGFVTYLGEESEDHRSAFIAKWCQRLKIEPFAVGPFLRSESALLKMKGEGLPGDSLSLENAIIMMEAIKTPLIADPASQALTWLVQHLHARDTVVEVASVTDDRFTHILELAIRFGKTFIATEIDSIDPLLYPVLRRDLISLGPKKVVQLGAKQVDWQETFNIFLCTRTTDLTITPDAASLVTLVNFSVTRSGLQSQLLGTTILHERPELEQLKVELLQKEEGLKVQLAELEESLLSDLANSHGNLLDNASLIDSLGNIKAQSKDISESLKQSEALQNELAQKRLIFQPLAVVGATLYFLIQELSALNRMYQFSLAAFLDIFKTNLTNYHSDDDVESKMGALSISLCQEAFLYVSRGLFKTDRVPFGLHVARGLAPEVFPSALWDVFIGRSRLPAEGVVVPSWATRSQAMLSGDLQAVHAADPTALSRWDIYNNAKWSSWLQDPNADRTILQLVPAAMDALLIVSIFFPERLISTMTYVVLEQLHLTSLAQVTSIDGLLPQTSATVPTLLITSAGADPSLEVQEVAWKTVGREAFTQIALGGGQTDEALTQLRRCAVNGEWLFLKNLHLVLGWTSSVLEKEICALTAPHANFRLWMTTEQHDSFPSVLLRSSLKMTVESPPGVKQNMLNTYATWQPSFIARCSVPQSQLLFALAWFHAVVSERRAYIPQGWVKLYEFTPADLRSAADIIVALLQQQNNVDWTTLKGVFDDAVYGGRLDTDRDVQTLRVLLKLIFNNETCIDGRRMLYEHIAVPKVNDHAVHVGVIQQLPDLSQSDMFRLPPNADNVVQETLGVRCRNDLKTLARGTLLSSPDAAVSSLAMTLVDVAKFWDSAPIAEPAPPPPMRQPKTGFPDPLDVFLVSELSALSMLIGEIRAVFAHIKDVIDGVALPSAALKAIAPSLAAFSTPDPWLDRMPGPEGLGGWLTTLTRKYQGTGRWYAAFTAGSLLSTKLDLTELLRPQVFLNALRQHTSRSTGAALVTLTLRATAGVGAKAPGPGIPVGVGAKAPGPGIPVVLLGSSLLVQGAVVSDSTGGSISVPSVDAPSTTPFVDVTVQWTTASDASRVKLPLYSDASRETLLLEVDVPMTPASEADEWALRGAALLLAN